MLDNDHEVAAVNHTTEDAGRLTATNFGISIKGPPAAGIGPSKQVSRENTSMTLSALAQAELVGKDKTP